ncbi:MAG TPA: Flp pilus assembly protein CpaB [Allosphingosinicella sp.]|nr:Flp pilus assembly protein CpaB [Allosphingosinicella sp.]
MDVKKLVLLIGALIIAAVTAVTAKNMFSGSGAPSASAGPVVPAGPEVLVATRALPVGTIIDAEAFRFQRWPEGLVQPAYYIKGKPGVRPADLVGTVVRNEITAGQPFTQGSLIKPGERGFLAAALGPGMRAVTVPVSATSGVAGFIFPGDRVDIVLTQEVAGGGDGVPLKVSETVMRNVRVLATDQRMSARGDDGKAVVQRFTMVTLEATPKIAEKIAVAQKIGDLSLSLRSIADNSAELERAIASGEVTVPATDDPKAERRMLLAIANQPVEGASTFTTGSDVSRFQRSTVPGRPQQQSSPAPAAPASAPGITISTSPAAPAVPTGPVVRISRGNNVTIVPVGAK